MKKIVFVLMMVMMVGCGDKSYQVNDEKQPDPWTSKIKTWQTAEMAYAGYPQPDNSGIVNMTTAREISLWFVGDQYAPANILYKPEPAGDDYWQPSYITESLGEGDCEDQAILFYIKMRDAGFPDDKIGIAILPPLVPTSNEYEAVAFFWAGNTLWMADNGYVHLFTGSPVRTFNLFKARSAL